MGQPEAVAGALVMCTFGVAPCALVPTPGTVMVAGRPAATIMDHTPANIATFGMCTTPSNPTVAAATAAAFGVLTPMPCVPMIPAPWAPGGPTTMIGGKPSLTASSMCVCGYGGAISITMPGQMQTTVA